MQKVLVKYILGPSASQQESCSFVALFCESSRKLSQGLNLDI